MPVTLSIKNAPDDIVRRLRARAEQHHRSLQGELMAIIEAAADEGHPATPASTLAEIRRLGLATRSDATPVVRADRDTQARYLAALVERVTDENRHDPADGTSIPDREANALARQVASLTGQSVVEVVRGSLELRLRDEQRKRSERPWDDQAIDAVIDRFNALPILDHRTDDEILGYDENGLPS